MPISTWPWDVVLLLFVQPEVWNQTYVYLNLSKYHNGGTLVHRVWATNVFTFKYSVKFIAVPQQLEQTYWYLILQNYLWIWFIVLYYWSFSHTNKAYVNWKETKELPELWSSSNEGIDFLEWWIVSEVKEQNGNKILTLNRLWCARTISLRAWFSMQYSK